MHDEKLRRDSTAESDFSRHVYTQATRKLKAQRAGILASGLVWACRDSSAGP